MHWNSKEKKTHGQNLKCKDEYISMWVLLQRVRNEILVVIILIKILEQSIVVAKTSSQVGGNQIIGNTLDDNVLVCVCQYVIETT